jgi:hypothetical protein
VYAQFLPAATRHWRVAAEKPPGQTLTSLPVRRQRVQTLRVVFVLPTSVRTFTRLGFQVRRVLLLAWETLFPVVVRFPHRSQVRDIGLEYSKFAPSCKAGACLPLAPARELPIILWRGSVRILPATLSLSLSKFRQFLAAEWGTVAVLYALCTLPAVVWRSDCFP